MESLIIAIEASLDMFPNLNFPIFKVVREVPLVAERNDAFLSRSRKDKCIRLIVVSG